MTTMTELSHPCPLCGRPVRTTVAAAAGFTPPTKRAECGRTLCVAAVDSCAEARQTYAARMTLAARRMTGDADGASA